MKIKKKIVKRTVIVLSGLLAFYFSTKPLTYLYVKCFFNKMIESNFNLIFFEIQGIALISLLSIAAGAIMAYAVKKIFDWAGG